MKPVQHVVVSSVLAAGLYAVLRSWEASVATVLSGVFIDCDHLLDYLIEAGPRFRPRDFFDFCENRRFKKTRLLWHGWEWVPVLLVASALSGWHPIMIGVLVGVAAHLTCDQWGNSPSRWGYFLLWRWAHGFDGEMSFPKRDDEDEQGAPDSGGSE